MGRSEQGSDPSADVGGEGIDVVSGSAHRRCVSLNGLRRQLAIAMTLLAIGILPLCAQVRTPVEGGTTASVGQPKLWKWSVGAATGALDQRSADVEVAQARLGLYRDLGNPVIALAGLQLDAYAGARGSRVDAGVKTRVVLPFARVAIGADYNAVDGHARLMYSVLHQWRRGGVFGEGSLLRFDYIPARNQSITAGLEVPIYRRVPTGKTRPGRDYVRLPLPAAGGDRVPAAPRTAQESIAAARRAAASIRVLAVPFLGRGTTGNAGANARLTEAIGALRPGVGGEPTTPAVEVATRRFHSAMERAFSAAHSTRPLVGDETTREGRAIAAQAREILLAEVLLPYDRLLGQVRKPDTILGFGSRARGIFTRWLHVNATLDRGRVNDVVAVFGALLDIVDENRGATRNEWNDSRFGWLPLQYALLPEDHDTQAELDAIIAMAVEQSFTEGNFVSYVINEQFQYQLSRTIRAAEDYHVLWTHDFRGIDDSGDPDEMSYRHVLRSYLAALTDRVRAYDRTGRFPVYMLLLDEWFYQVRKARLWVNLLEDPTRYRVELPARFKAWEDTIASAQAQLRSAIAASSLLQAQRAQYGDAWLRDLVKVHVSITNPADPTFWSRSLVRGMPLADNMMRDHRKLVFYDITEEDPYRGEAMYTGAGIGEHYSNLSWEDRSLLVRGPAALGLKQAARNLLLNQGIAAARIPSSLQPRAMPDNYGEQVRNAMRQSAGSLRAVGLHNGTGFASKQINVAKAVLYTLMPPGSVVKIPDSLWNNDFWGAVLFGSALRGVRVLVIAPSDASNPVGAFGPRTLSREMLMRLIVSRAALAPEIAAAGGLLKIGIYDSEVRVTDIPGKVGAVRRTFAESAWLRELFGFPPIVYEELGTTSDQVARLAMAARDQGEFESEQRTKLHLKANFFASREAWQVMTRPEWGSMTWTFVTLRIAQVQSRSEAVVRFDEFPDALLDIGGDYVQDWYSRLDAGTRERVVFYTIMGSQNQNFRSMIVDGEDAFVVAHWPSVIPYLDFISLIGQSKWVETPAELDALLLPKSRLKAGLSHWFRLAF